VTWKFVAACLRAAALRRSAPLLDKQRVLHWVLSVVSAKIILLKLLLGFGFGILILALL
jgi:hypothetical protein